MKRLCEKLLRVKRVWLRGKALLTTMLLRAPNDSGLRNELCARAVSIVVPVHDAHEVVSRCLGSLERFGADAEVIVVDDGSKCEPTRKLLALYCSRNGWRLLRNESPAGHSRACEMGAREATRDILCLLNSDTVVTSVSWKSVVEAFDSDDRIAVVGPTTSWAATPQQDETARICRHRWSDAKIEAYARYYVSKVSESASEDLEEISGCAFFIRSEIWRRYGGFHEYLKDYGNESELCRRLLRDGFRCVWSRAAYVHHLGQQSYGGVSIGYREAMRTFIEGLDFVERSGVKERGESQR